MASDGHLLKSGDKMECLVDRAGGSDSARIFENSDLARAYGYLYWLGRSRRNIHCHKFISLDDAGPMLNEIAHGHSGGTGRF
jgi:hypothetical protein